MGFTPRRFTGLISERQGECEVRRRIGWLVNTAPRRAEQLVGDKHNGERS